MARQNLTRNEDRKRLPSLRALQAALALARAGGFGAAAARLNVTRSAVSHLIRDLEGQLGARLFERTPAGVVPTDQGRILLAGIEQPVAQIEAAMAAFARDRAEVRLSTVSTFAQYWLIPRLPAFHAARPDVRVTVSTSVQTVDFDRQEADCAIRHGFGAWPGLESALIVRESLVAVAPVARLAAFRAGDVAGFLRAAPLVAAASRPDDLRRWWQAQGLAGAPPRPMLTVENRAEALAAVLSGAGVALIDPIYLSGATPAASLAVLPIPPVPLPTAYYFVAPPRQSRRRNVALLRTWILAEAARMREGPEQAVAAAPQSK